MAIWRISAKRKSNSKAYPIEPGMEVEFVLKSNSTSASSVYASKENRELIAQSFISKYGLKCTVEQFAPQVNNVNFDYTLIRK